MPWIGLVHPLRSWLWESRGITRLLPKPHGEPVFFLDKVRLGVIVGTHTWNNFVPHTHASSVNITVVAHDIDQRLIARVAHARLHPVYCHSIGQSAGTLNLKAGCGITISYLFNDWWFWQSNNNSRAQGSSIVE